MNTPTDVARGLLAAAFSAALAGCGGGGGAGTGELTLRVTDAPVDSADAVVVQFTGVEAQPAEGERQVFVFDAPRQIDLLALQGGESALLLDGVEVPAGAYSWLRLAVDAEFDGVADSYIQIGDAQHELRIPSGGQSGLKLNRGFVVPVGGAADFTIDFDLRQSVRAPRGQPGYLLRPTLRLVDNAEAGAVAGAVDPALIDAAGCPAWVAGEDAVDPVPGRVVYVYAGAGVTPDDVDGSDPEPLTSAQVMATLDADTQTLVYDYRAAFLPPGDYTLAYTCEAEADVPDADDAIGFAATAEVVVVNGETVTLDF